MNKKVYIAPLCESTYVSSANMMKYTGPASVPGQAGVPRRKTEVF